VGELVYRLIKAAGVMVTPELATCLYTTVLTDTGGFCYGSTQASTFALAQKLVKAGADPIRIARTCTFSVATSKLLLLGAALGPLAIARAAWPGCGLSPRHGTQLRSEEDCEGIANHALSIAGVEAAVFSARAAGTANSNQYAQQRRGQRCRNR